MSDFLSIRVRFVAAVDTRWRYAVYSRLTPVGSGPQGQQIWTLKVEDAAFVLAQMQVYQGFRLLTDQKVEMVNGQTLTVKTSEPRGYTGGMQRESAVGLGYQPKAEQLEEGVTLRLSPLLTFDGDALDAAIDLTANTVKSLHRTRVIAPREIGPSEITLDVPEVTESRLNQTVKGWPLGQTLLISGGHPAGHPPGQGRVHEPADPRHGPQRHRAARLPRRRGRRPPPPRRRARPRPRTDEPATAAGGEHDRPVAAGSRARRRVSRRASSRPDDRGCASAVSPSGGIASITTEDRSELDRPASRGVPDHHAVSPRPARPSRRAEPRASSPRSAANISPWRSCSA